MIILVASVFVVLTVPLSGRSLAPLADLSLRWVWLVWLSIALQLPITLLTIPNWLGQPLHLMTFVLAAAFICANWGLPGVPLLAIGAGLNLAAIAANGGTMPASDWAWRTAGFPTLVGSFENSNVVHHARLAWFGDVFAIPKGLPFANVFSVGDVIVVIAIAYFVHVWCRRQVEQTPDGIEAVLANP